MTNAEREAQWQRIDALLEQLSFVGSRSTGWEIPQPAAPPKLTLIQGGRDD